MVYLWFWVSLNAQLGVLLQAAAMMTDGYAREPVDHRRPRWSSRTARTFALGSAGLNPSGFH